MIHRTRPGAGRGGCWRSGTGPFLTRRQCEKRSGLALLAGLVSALAGALNLAVADGGPGTGNGVVGGAMAVLLGLVAVVLGGLALTRTRRTTPSRNRP